MRKEFIIRMQPKCEKCHSKAMKVAAAVSGVESVTLAGGEKNLLLVIGDGVDSNRLTKRLEKKVGHAEIVELRTLEMTTEAAATRTGKEITQYPYQWRPTPSPYYSPMVARGYTTSNYYYSGMVARDHPGNYSPMIERHDYYYPSNSHKVVRHEYPSAHSNCSIL